MSDDNTQPTTTDNDYENNKDENNKVTTTTPAKGKNTNNNNNNKKGSTTTAQGQKPTKAQIEQSVYRKSWVDRIVMVILVAALIVYFIVLIISMISSGNSTVVEKEETISKMNVPLQYVELYSETASSTSTGIDCEVTFYVGDEIKVKGKYLEKEFDTTSDDGTVAEGWEVLNLVEYAAGSEEYNYTGVLVVPPSDTIFKIDRNLKNYVSVDCADGSNVTVLVNMYHEGQYDQYESGPEEIDAISYDAYDARMGFDTNFDLTLYTITDELQFASRPQALEGIEGAYDYYELDLSGVYPLNGKNSVTNSRSTATYSGYRKQTKYVYQDATTFYDVVAAIGGMYTSLASIIAWFTIKFLWGHEFKIYSFKVYKWTGFAPYAPKDKEKKEGEEGEEAGDDAGDDGLDV